MKSSNEEGNEKIISKEDEKTRFSNITLNNEKQYKFNKITLILLIIIILLSVCIIVLIILLLKEDKEKNNSDTIISDKIEKINFLGDSITEGYGPINPPGQKYTSLIEKKINIKAYDFGVGGTRIARQDDDLRDYNYRVYDLNLKANFTFVFGGTNDYSWGAAELGDINSTTVYTFYGAVRNLVEVLLQTWDNKHICFILPTSRFNENVTLTHGPLQVYRDIIQEVCDLYKVDTLSMTEELPIPSTDGASEFFTDGLHPNAKGHEIMADAIIKYLKNKNLI